MFLDITKTLGINDIGSLSAKQHPIFKATETLFGKLLTAPMNTEISNEIPEINVKLTGIILSNQIKLQKDLYDVVSIFKEIIVFAMVLFCINLRINITGLTYSYYKVYCMVEIRQNRCIQQAREQLDL